MDGTNWMPRPFGQGRDDTAERRAEVRRAAGLTAVMMVMTVCGVIAIEAAFPAPLQGRTGWALLEMPL